MLLSSLGQLRLIKLSLVPFKESIRHIQDQNVLYHKMRSYFIERSDTLIGGYTEGSGSHRAKQTPKGECKDADLRDFTITVFSLMQMKVAGRRHFRFHTVNQAGYVNSSEWIVNEGSCFL